jgi:hypothetical protein
MAIQHVTKLVEVSKLAGQRVNDSLNEDEGGGAAGPSRVPFSIIEAATPR